MMPRWLPLTLAVVIVAPGFLFAQQQSPNPLQSPSLPQQAGAPPSGKAIDAEKMYEDVEILRRILERKLHALYAPNADAIRFWLGGSSSSDHRPLTIDYGFPVNPADASNLGYYAPAQALVNQAARGNQTARPAFNLEGVYLKGQGVVYTVTLPSLEPTAKAKSHASATSYQGYLREAAVESSEWDSVRRQVRNEKDEPKKAETSKPPSLSDVLLKVLIENGHHFSQLEGKESLSIVVTVREPNPSAASRQSSSASNDPARPGPQGQLPLDAWAAGKLPLSVWAAGSQTSNRPRDLELLGDLHLRQGRYDEALKHYKQIAKERTNAGLYRKLAQCYLCLEKYDEARAALDQAIALAKKDSDGKNKPAEDKKPSALPVKMIISVSKLLLETAKDRKTSFEEIRRQAHVETLRFTDHR